MTNQLQSDLYNEIMEEIRLSWDSHDPFGSVMEWQFAIAEVLKFDCDHNVPDFRTFATEPEDTYNVETLRAYQPDGIRDEDWPRDRWAEYAAYIEALTSILAVLGRYREWCRVWGRDY